MRKETRFKQFRNLAERLLLLVLAPASVTLAIIILQSFETGKSAGSCIEYIFAVMILLAFLAYAVAYTSIFEEYLNTRHKKRRVRRFRKPCVLILDGRIEDDSGSPPEPAFADRTPQQWVKSLRDKYPSWKVRSAPICHICESSNIDIVVNPFGEVYPEEEPGLYSTFSAVRRYVFSGGVWVNVAGFPFYYQHNPTTNTPHLAGRAGKAQEHKPGLQTYEWVPLINDALPFIVPDMGPGESSCSVKQNPTEIEQFGDIAGKGVPYTANVFRAYPVNTRQMQPLLRSNDNKWIVIGSVKYGDGFFIFAGLDIRDSTGGGFEKVEAAIGGWAMYEASAK